LSKKTSAKDKRPARETDPELVRGALLRRLSRRLGAAGQIVLPSVPALRDHFTELVRDAFATLGRVFDATETEHLRSVLERKLAEGFALSHYSRVIVNYETHPPPATALSYNVLVVRSTIEHEYENWVRLREPPLFGLHPDAKVLECARSLGPPSEVPVLDVGAGTGRNTLPLAREGFPTDAVELAPALANILRGEVEKERLPVRVFEGNALTRELELPTEHYRLVFMAEVIASHIRSVDELRLAFERAASSLAAGGLFLFNAFVARDAYRPDALARELSQVFWCNLFTKTDIAEAMAGLPLEFVSDESTHDFESARQSAEAWPPTGWFVEWARGLNLFNLPGGRAPIDLRWLVYRRR
jgi:SAM-dependent methyltransferase